ncbi:MAG: cobalamin-binding protein [Actinobacteria bacterium]|nr:cobalamin-binding protein [Actinomycetota bacterium]
MQETLAEKLADLREDEVGEEVRRKLEEGVTAEEILADLQKGMVMVGERFQNQEYYLPELIMAADIFTAATASLGDTLKGSKEKIATMVLGTVAGDIHDIGKNIVGLIFGSNGFEVVDLGVDVPPQRFVEAVKEYKPQLVGLSCLLTTSFNSMRETVEALKEAGLRDGVKVLVGGGPVDQGTADYCGADAYCVDAPTGIRIARELLGVS